MHCAAPGRAAAAAEGLTRLVWPPVGYKGLVMR